MFFRTSCRCTGQSSFSRELESLVRRVRSLPVKLAAGNSTANQADVWRSLGQLSAKAHALKETDTVFGVLEHLLRKGWTPPSLEVWSNLAQHLLPYSDVESHAVLHFPGASEEIVAAGQAVSPTTASSLEFSRSTWGSHVHPSRETLLLTGGVIPLSARFPCSDGRTLGIFLNHFCVHVRSQMSWLTKTEEDWKGGVDSFPQCLFQHLQDMMRIVIAAIAINQATLSVEQLAESFTAFLKLFWDVGVLTAVIEKSKLPENTSAEDSAESQLAPITSITTSFSSAIASLLAIGVQGVGPTLALHYFSSLSVGEWISSGPHAWREEKGSPMWPAHLAQVQMEALMSVVHAMRPICSVATVDIAPRLRTVERTLDRVFQHNANNENRLRISSDSEQQYRLDVAEMLLAGMRREALSPDNFLRDAMELVDRFPPSMAIEAELLSAKVQLLDVFDLDKEGKQAVYNDLLSSLRNLVELRPRVNCFDGQENIGTVDRSLADLQDSNQSRLDTNSQRLMQRAHQEVITVLSSSGDETYLNEAYGVLISHKYHGLVITKEVIRPLLRAFAQKGDGRVFNLVDLCVLYSNNTVDMDVLGALFQTCAVNGDYYRASSLLQLLEDSIPGFLLKASDDVIEALRSLRILPNEPLHLFATQEDISIFKALGRTPAPLLELP
eukprot:gene10859-7525_t